MTSERAPDSQGVVANAAPKTEETSSITIQSAICNEEQPTRGEFASTTSPESQLTQEAQSGTNSRLSQPANDDSTTKSAPQLQSSDASSSIRHGSASPGDESHRNSAASTIAALEQQLRKSKHDLESMVINYARSESDNLQNKRKIDDLDKRLKRAIKDNESLANRVKILTNDKNHLSESLNAKLAQLTVLEQKNSSISTDQSNKLKELEEKVANLEALNEGLLKQIETYKHKEGELLDFSERLSMKQLLLQAELDKALENAPDFNVQYRHIVKERDELSERVDQLSSQLEVTRNELDLERTQREQVIGERDSLEFKWRRSIEELENEIKVMRRRHQIAVKELVKQIRNTQSRTVDSGSDKELKNANAASNVVLAAHNKV